VDDGSRDATPAILRASASSWPEVRVLALERNQGQASALLCGLHAARGAILVTLDGDGQNDSAKGKLTMPVLAVGGEKSFGMMMATVMRFAASNVQEAVVPDSGHWIMEENPQATIDIVRAFLVRRE
jgi:glycosyltransferase involved in cell wall biosynthesis